MGTLRYLSSLGRDKYARDRLQRCKSLKPYCNETTLRSRIPAKLVYIGAFVWTSCPFFKPKKYTAPKLMVMTWPERSQRTSRKFVCVYRGGPDLVNVPPELNLYS